MINFNEGGATQFLNKLEECMAEIISRDAIQDILHRYPPVMTFIRDSSFKLSFCKALCSIKLFYGPLRVRTMNLTDMSAVELLNGIDRTKQVLR